MRWLATAGQLLLLVAMSCGGRTPHPGTEVNESFGYRSPILPAGSIVLPDSFGGVRNPHDIVLNPTNGHMYICGRTGDLGVAVLEAATGQQVGMIPARDADGIEYNPVTNKLYISAGRGVTGEFLVVDCSTDSIVARDAWSPLPLCVNVTENKLYVARREGRDSKVLILDGRTRRTLAKVRLGPAVKRGLDRIIWNPINNALYCNDENSGALVIIDGRTDRELARIVSRYDLFPGCVNTRDNTVYAVAGSADDSSVAVIEGSTNKVVAWLEAGPRIANMAYNPIENKVYCTAGLGSGGSQHSVVVIDGADDRVLSRLTMPDVPEEICYDSVNNRMYCFGHAAGWVAAIDCRADTIVGVARAGEDMSPAVFCASANRLYCLDWRPGDVYALDCAAFSVVDTLTLGFRVGSMVYNRKKDKLYCANHMGHALVVVDGASGRVRGTIEVGRSPTALAFSPGGKKLYCANAGDGTIHTIDCNSDRVIATVRVGYGPSALCLSPTNSHLFCANTGGFGQNRDSTVSVIDCRSGNAVATLTGGQMPRLLAFDSVHGHVFCASTAGRVGQEDPAMRVDAFDAATLRRTFSVSFPGYPQDMCYDAVHDRLYLAHSEPDNLTVVDCSAGVVKTHLWADGSPEKLCYNAPRHKLYCASPNIVSGKGTEGNNDSEVRGRSTGGGGRTVAVVDTDGDSSVARIEVPRGPDALCYVPETDQVYCACAGSDTVIAIDCATDRIVGRKAVGAGPASLEYSPKHTDLCSSRTHGPAASQPSPSPTSPPTPLERIPQRRADEDSVRSSEPPDSGGSLLLEPALNGVPLRLVPQVPIRIAPPTAILTTSQTALRIASRTVPGTVPKVVRRTVT
jgi:YVTN family beta-propeller protein